MFKKYFIFFLVATISWTQAAPASEDPERVIGGTDAPEGAAPYQVSLRVAWGFHLCGASILTSRTILTAGHCLTSVTAEDIWIMVGTNKLDEGGDRYEVEKITIHPEYSPFTQKNDIAIITLSSPIKFNSLVKAIPIETKDVGGGVSAVLTGWGTTKYPEITAPNDLQIITLKTISFEECKSRNGVPTLSIYESQVCTLTRVAEGACHGDSGGPLVANGKQIGVVSWGYPCAVGYPDVFTRVSSFADWIKQNTVN